MPVEVSDVTKAYRETVRLRQQFQSSEYLAREITPTFEGCGSIRRDKQIVFFHIYPKVGMLSA